MTEGADTGRLTIDWSLDAQAQLRAIDRQTALEILHGLDRYITTRNGDVKKLRPPMVGFRLRCGDYRVFFKQAGEQGISITGVCHRREAYR